MGNKFCCQQEPKKQFDHTITVIHKQQVVKIPIVNPIVAAHLARQKPFYLDQPTNPTIKQYDDDVYQGKIDDRGRPTGYGKMYHKNGSVFIGQFVTGIANGNGHFVKNDGSYYHGKMKNNKASDQNGKYWSQDFQYVGGIVNNQIQGQGRQIGLNHTFQGTYKDGKKLNGVLKWKQGVNQYEYVGGFNQQGNFEGKGKLWHKSKGIYTGDFANGNKHGKGQFIFHSGTRYIGQYYHNVKEGQGKVISKNGQVAYEGQFKNDIPHGKGKAPNQEGQLKQRQWIEGIDKLLIQQ